MMTEFDDKVKLARKWKRYQQNVTRLEKELATAKEEQRLAFEALRQQELHLGLAALGLPDTVIRQLNKSEMYRIADVLALNAHHMPQGIGKKTFAALDEAMRKHGLRVPTDSDGRG